MAEVRRDQFRQHILKLVVMRLDFRGVLESELDQVLTQVKSYAQENDLPRYEERGTSDLYIDLEGEKQQSIETTRKARCQKIFSFANTTRGITLEISRDFICLAVRTEAYIPFEDYGSIVLDVANIYKNSLEYFTPKRFGLRKVNECLISDKDKIREYFNPAIVSYYDYIGGVDTARSNRTECFTVDNYHVNLRSNIAKGRQGGDTLYAMRLDIDTYLDDKEQIHRLLSNSDEVKRANNLIFKIFISSLTEHFVNLLMAEDTADDVAIQGVEFNGW